MPQRVANLHSFARLYGVVRWFHPSDAAAAIDWDHFAIDGARRVIDASDADALRVRLADLFALIAPTVQIRHAGETFSDDSALHSASTAGVDVIAWQHKGYGDSTIATGYASKRLHRGLRAAQPGPRFAALSQTIDAIPFRNSRVRLRGKLRTAHHARGQLWLRVDRGDSAGFFDNMIRHPVVSETWVQAEIVGTVDADATRITFGELNAGVGTVWYDDLELSVETKDGTWQSIEIQDGGFEAADPLNSWRPSGNTSATGGALEGWNVTIDHSLPASGASSLRIEKAVTMVTQELFEQAPAAGESVDIELGSGLRARVPLALYSKEGRTIGDDPERAQHVQATYRLPAQPGFDVLTGVADVIVLWNVLEHFWPYWSTVSLDWSGMLDAALAQALDDRDIERHVATLDRLSTGAPDGHIGVSCPGESDYGYPPFALDLAESQIIVTASADPAVKRGDVLLSIDGRPAAQRLADERALISGSPQWRALRALQRLGRGRPGSVLELRLLRDKHELDVTARRIDHSVLEDPSHAAIAHLDDGIYYIDTSRAALMDINAEMSHLAAASGIIFDFRNPPKHNHEVLSHILARSDAPKGWEAIPLIIRPDTASAPASWEDTSNGNMPQLSVQQPHIGGRVALLIGPAAISYAESVLSLVEYYHLGEIVGSPTAGTNGDIAEIGLPTGCTTRFTGRRVTKPDGRRQHLIGIQPTIPASRTIAGILEQRDEVLEKALSSIRSAK